MNVKLIDLIKPVNVKLGTFKIHCATGKNPTPLEAFFRNEFKQWQEQQNQKNFQCEQIISLIGLNSGKWLFAGIYLVRGFVTRYINGKKRYIYSTKEVKGLEHLTGRVVVEFDKKFRASYLRGEKYYDRLCVSEIRSQRMTIGNFPGYDSISITFYMLQTIVQEDNPSWKAALSNVSGIYVVADNASGKLYVGSASGGQGLWERWVSYSKNGHGGNKEIKALVKHKGLRYSSHFQFSVLEVCDLKASDDHIISRENHWKQILLTREFGLNKN
jgi:hypothetical protein